MNKKEDKSVDIECNIKSVEQTLDEFQTSRDGLTKGEAKKRHKKYGPNQLPGKKAVKLYKVILNQFKSPLIYILLAAGIISSIIGELKDAIFIFFIIILNSGLGTYQEWKAEKSAESLESFLKKYSKVKRDKEKKNLEVEELVPGDIVFIESGDKVPADLRLIEEKNLRIDESILTGESTAVGKNIQQMEESGQASDCFNIAFAGTTVTSGRGMGVVIKTGLDTEVGKIAEAVYASESVKPPLLVRMDRFSKQIGLIVLGASVLVAIIAILQGSEYLDVFLLAVALAVSAIPEGLPVAITVALSISTNRMAKRNVIIRKLAAVESLGSCTLIASDKTGTLTLNKQTVQLIVSGEGDKYRVTGEGYNDEGKILNEGEEEEKENDLIKNIVISVILDNESNLIKEDEKWDYSGDPMEIALLAFSYKAGFNPKEIRYKTNILGEIPFESENKFSAKFYKRNGESKVAVKGAAEVVVPMCKKTKVKGNTKGIDAKFIQKKVKELTKEGYRVLAVAEGKTEKKKDYDNLKKEDLPDLTFLGLIGFLDPLRPNVEEAVQKAKKAGIKVVMITGDHPETALTIAKKLSIAQEMDNVITGNDFKEDINGEDKEFIEKIREKNVFARVSPIQKLDIVEALRNMGNFVAVTGDGVNDAPALKRANIGVAMGSGTDVTKDTASIIVTDDSFSSIVAGVEEGRFAYNNIRKVTYLLISTGAAEVVLFITALLSGLPLALVAIQLLWLNLVTNGIQDIALAFEGGEKRVMSKKPRDPSEGIFNRLMIEQTLISGLTMAGISIGVWFYLMSTGWEVAEARNILLLLMVLLQNFHVFNCRSEEESIFKVPISRNYLLIMGVIAAQGIHIASLFIKPMQDLLGTNPVTITNWLILFAIASIIIFVMEIYKIIKRKKELKES